MPTVNTTTEKAKVGVGLATKQLTIIQIEPAYVELLIGGPYTSNGKEHTYGHVALRVSFQAEERIYDFGRYNGENGPYGQGRLRIWTKFSKYIAGENATGRLTTGFVYRVPLETIAQVNAHFNGLIAGQAVLKSFGDYMKEYRLSEDYHALNNNCTTVAMNAARIALKDIDGNVSKFNEGRGMSMAERAAAHMAGWPKYIFLPADLQAMLQENSKRRPERIERYGEKK